MNIRSPVSLSSSGPWSCRVMLRPPLTHTWRSTPRGHTGPLAQCWTPVWPLSPVVQYWSHTCLPSPCTRGAGLTLAPSSALPNAFCFLLHGSQRHPHTCPASACLECWFSVHSACLPESAIVRAMSPHVIPCHPMSPHVIPCHPMSSHSNHTTHANIQHSQPTGSLAALRYCFRSKAFLSDSVKLCQTGRRWKSATDNACVHLCKSFQDHPFTEGHDRQHHCHTMHCLHFVQVVVLGLVCQSAHTQDVRIIFVTGYSRCRRCTHVLVCWGLRVESTLWLPFSTDLAPGGRGDWPWLSCFFTGLGLNRHLGLWSYT